MSSPVVAAAAAAGPSSPVPVFVSWVSVPFVPVGDRDRGSDRDLPGLGVVAAQERHAGCFEQADEEAGREDRLPHLEDPDPGQ